VILSNASGRAARLQYTMSNFKVLAPGDYVVCAQTGVPIPLGQLKYWSHERQEAYANAEAASARHAAVQAGQ
jgi:hypothetical protein